MVWLVSIFPVAAAGSRGQEVSVAPFSCYTSITQNDHTWTEAELLLTPSDRLAQKQPTCVSILCPRAYVRMHAERFPFVHSVVKITF